MMRLLVLESLKSPRLDRLVNTLFMQTSLQTIEIVDSFLRAKFIYASEIVETLQYPDYMLQGLEASGHLVGDCDDISTLHAALLTAMGFKVRFVAIKSLRDISDYDHVYIEVQHNNKWIMYDVTLPLGTNVEYFGRLTIQV